MENTNSPSPTAIVIQPQSCQVDSKSNKRIFRLGWMSFILGACAFLIHYISLDQLANFSPINAGIISGFFLIIAGLASVIAGYQETSYRCHIHAQIWSFIVNMILAPGLITVSIAALILDGHDIHPRCQPTVSSSSRVVFLSNSLEDYSSNVPCLEVIKLMNLSQILNTVQLIIGVICFFVHMILLSNQKKIIKQIKMNQNDAKKQIIVYTRSSFNSMNQRTFTADLPPKYEDLPSAQAIAE